MGYYYILLCNYDIRYALLEIMIIGVHEETGKEKGRNCWVNGNMMDEMMIDINSGHIDKFYR